ncbi:MAG TPA: ribosomal-processing cysteine protease Prp [Candidatus Baltobacteraceae bacterium]
MVDITFRRDSLNRLSSVFSTGHVEIPESSSDEYSLVCAAISAILQAARLGVSEHAGIEVEALQRRGELSLRWPESDRDNPRVDAIIHTAELATRQIATQFPQHVRVRDAIEA